MTINVINNGNFEKTEAWKPYRSTSANTCTYIKNNAHSGSTCMRLSTTAAGWSAIFQKIVLSAGKTYKLSMYAKRNGIDVWIAYRDPAGKMHHYPSLMNKIGNNYSKVVQELSVAGNGKQEIELFIIAGSVAGDAWIDDVELLDDVQDEITSSYPDALVCGDFENDADEKWQLDGVQIVSGSGNAHSGSKCILFSGNSNKLGAIRQLVELIPGCKYVLTYYAKRSGSAGMQPSIQYTKSDGSYGYLYPNVNYYGIYNVYTQQHFEFTLPSYAASGLVRLAMNGHCSSGESSSLYLDDVKLYGPVLRTAKISKAQTQVWSKPNGTGTVHIKYRNGTPITIREIDGNNECYETFVGREPNKKAYVRKDCVTDICNKDAATRIAEIAQFYVGIKKSDAAINLEGQWCQSFANVCVGQAGLFAGNPWIDNSNCITAWNTIRKLNKPIKGSLVFTRNKDSDTVSHVAVVVSDVDDVGEFTIVEGDLDGSNVVKTRKIGMNHETTIGYGLPNGIKL